MRTSVRSRVLLAGVAIVAVVAVVVALVLAGGESAGKRAASPPAASAAPTGATLAALIRGITTVPASVLDTVGAGVLSKAGIGTAATYGSGYLVPVSGQPLTAGGKPEVLYVGADFCPYCAAARWPLIVALSRFGSLSGLATATSGVTNGAGQAEPYPATPTWTFSRVVYKSAYVTFDAAELESSVPDPGTGGYKVLRSLTASEHAVVSRYDPSQSIPFVDIGGSYVQMSNLAPYGPRELAGKTWSQVTASLRDPSSQLGKDIDASANYLTAAICELTGDRPASACTPAVTALQGNLG